MHSLAGSTWGFITPAPIKLNTSSRFNGKSSPYCSVPSFFSIGFSHCLHLTRQTPNQKYHSGHLPPLDIFCERITGILVCSIIKKETPGQARDGIKNGGFLRLSLRTGSGRLFYYCLVRVLYLMGFGLSASSPRRFLRSASYSLQLPSNHTTLESPS